MLEIREVTLPALTGDVPRKAYIYLPDFLKDDRSLRLPVLYMFDGHNLFDDEEATYGKSWGLLEYMEETQTPLIIAGVECNHDPNNGRLNEYSPFSFDSPDMGHIRPKGKATMDWLTTDFKAMMDAEYPTLPDREHTFLAGSSMGGLMTLYGVMKYNQVFSRGAALSPSVWFARERLERMLRSARVRRDTVLYMDYGQREMDHRDMMDWFSHVAGLIWSKKVNLTCRIVPNGTHCEASWERQIPLFMETLLYDLEF